MQPSPCSILPRRFGVIGIALVLTPLLLFWSPNPASGQSPEQGVASITLDEAIQIALVRNYLVRDARLDVANAQSLVREGWGQVFPQLSLNSTYTRNVKSANPFAGSDAGGLFQSLGFLDWLAFNERARTDTDPASLPITLEEFFVRQAAGLDAAGIEISNSDNPFAIPNQFRTGVSVTQKVFDIRTFWGVAGAQKYLKDLNEAGVQRQEHILIDTVRRQYYQALLASARKRVVSQSVERTRKTAEEASLRVARGVAPKFQRLSAEVELANLETQLIETSGASDSALDQLKFTLGIPVGQSIRLATELKPVDDAMLRTAALDGAVDLALRNRPDVTQSELNIELQKIQWKVARADYFPLLDAFADVSYVGNVPDNRTSTLSNSDDPFSFTRLENGFFSDRYWDMTASVGFTLSWTIFDGFQRHQRVQQRSIAMDRAEIAKQQLAEAVQLEVETALRGLRTARLRILSQEKNVERAELNYEYASARLREGVASPLDEREASELLDQSRLSYLQAVFDFNVALSQLETATGVVRPVATNTDLTFNIAGPATLTKKNDD
ncbi:MAG: TolC family protein [Rhodothermales bacterium]|nr:TolC family protein [Rhodothermales bacterium]